MKGKYVAKFGGNEQAVVAWVRGAKPKDLPKLREALKGFGPFEYECGSLEGMQYLVGALVERGHTVQVLEKRKPKAKAKPKKAKTARRKRRGVLVRDRNGNPLYERMPWEYSP